MAGWLDGWIARWVAGCLDGWIDGWMARSRYRGMDGDGARYSGLYSYSVRDNKWTLLRSDNNHRSEVASLKSRIGRVVINELFNSINSVALWPSGHHRNVATSVAQNQVTLEC